MWKIERKDDSFIIFGNGVIGRLASVTDFKKYAMQVSSDLLTEVERINSLTELAHVISDTLRTLELTDEQKAMEMEIGEH